jgi:hypothetical protein
MATKIQIKRGTLVNAGILSAGEQFFDTTTKIAYVGDGTQNYAAVMAAETSLVGKAFFLDEDSFLSNDATKVASQQSIKAYVDGKVVGTLSYVGGYDADTNTPDLTTSPAGVLKGDTYTVTVAGTFFGEVMQVGDVIIAETDNPVDINDWTRVQKNVDIATTTTPGIVKFAASGVSEAGSAVLATDSRLSDARTPTSHSPSHISGAGDEIDGDRLDIDWSPTNYTPNTTPAQVTSAEHLTAHLAGIDVKLAAFDTQTFTGLTDTPANYNGASLNVLRVNSGETGLESVSFAGTYLEATPTAALGTKAPTSGWANAHNAASGNVHGVPNGETILHTASVIDGGTV